MRVVGRRLGRKRAFRLTCPAWRIQLRRHGWARLVSAALSLPTTLDVAHADNVVGAWESPAANNWPLIAVHAALTPDGRVLTYGTWSIINGQNNPAQQTGYFKYDIWDPATGLGGSHLTLDSARDTDIFCSSQVILPQSGSIFIAGGDNWTGTGTTNTGNNNSNIFRPVDNTLYRETITGQPTQFKNMNRARWYSSSTALTNGEIYIQGGNGGGDRPEVRDLNGNFRLLSNVNTSSLAATFPRNFLAPDGRVFGYDTNGNMYYVNTAGTGQLTAAGQFTSSYAGWTSSAAMYRPGKVLQMGGNSNGSVVIDITGPQPVVTPVNQLMSSKRQWVSATVLADGRVLATGGSSADNTLNDVNTSAEIWNPANGTWTVGPSGSRARLYHSGALLLPNGSVLVTGGGAPGPLQNLHSEIYYPSYLYSAPNVFAARPSIVTAPDTLEIGVDFSMGVGAADVRRLTFVKTGSVTHSVNMDQRFIELPFTSSNGTLFVQMTDKVTDMPPGYYLMFAFNQSGVPSHAKIVRVNIPANPLIELDYTAVVGGSGGAPFQVSCNSDETVVGIFGNSAGTYVNRVGVRCVQVDQSGRWIGNPVNRGSAGTATGTAYTKTCPPDFAVSGYRGRASQFVDQLDFQCRALTPSGKLTGTVQYLGAVGGAGGTTQGPFSCSTNNPVYMLTGRSGSVIDAFGMQCREAPITQVEVNTPPSLTNPGNQVSEVGAPVNLQVIATDADIPADPLTFSSTGLPPGLGISTGGLISGAPTTAGTYPVSISVSDGTVSTTANLTWTVTDLDPLILNPMPKQQPNVFGTAVTYTASVQNAINPQFKWFFDDGTETGWSSSPSVTHTFTRPSLFYVGVSARDDRGIEQSYTFSQLVHLPLTAAPPVISGQMALGGGRLWVVNQDNDSVSVFSTANNQKLAEVAVGVGPRALAFAPDGDVWVTNKHSSNITVLDATALTVERNVPLPYGSQPYGLVFAPDGSAGFVALEGAGRILKLDPVSGAEIGNIFVGPAPRHLSMNANGTRLFASRFITPRLLGEDTANITIEAGSGGEILTVDSATLATSVVVLRHSADMDFENQGSGIPNYLGPVVISPDGASAWVPSKKDNVTRGTLRSGGNLNFQNTVRAISSRIDLATNTETFGARIDHDNASLASAAAFERYGVFMFVALETSREVAVINAHDRAQVFRINVGRAPQAIAVSADGYRLYVSNFMDRTIGVYDLTALIDEGQWNVPLIATLQSVTTEKLSPTVLAGKQLFYDARDTRLTREGYMSCASCHNDGGGDGRVWDLTGMGEGLRNTVSLRGKNGMAHGFLHWSANFDEVQDFEGQIRVLAGGTGLMSDALFNQGTRSQPLGDPKAGLSTELDALAAYIASLDSVGNSPFRNPNGSLTSAGVAGKAVFRAQGCVDCHSGANFTISGAATLRDVGTIRQPGSGKRLGAQLTGLDPPTLRGLWNTAPYLHDGSAVTLADAVQRHNGIAIGQTDLNMLVSYLQQVDQLEPAPTANGAPVVTNPGAQSGTVGMPVSLQIAASDPDGNALTFSATNLPAGLTISPTGGLISGSPSAAVTATVTVTANDGHGGTGSTTFSWVVASANAPPVVTNPGSQNGRVGLAVSLQIGATDPNGDSLSYSAAGLPAGLTISSSTGRITGAPTKQGNSNVTVTVSDGRGGTSTALFKWFIAKR